MQAKRSGHSITDIAAVFITIGLLVGWACGKTTVTANYVDPYADGVLTAPLDSVFRNIFPDGEPGASVFVMQNDSIIYSRSFGVANFRTGEMMTDSTMVNLASISKIFSAAALLKLAEEGKIDLDDCISKYFPEFPHKVFDKITIRHILSHSTGLPDLRPRDNDEWKNYLSNYESVFGFGTDYRLYGTENEHILVFRNVGSTEFEPGHHFQLNDPGYIIVAPLIERVTGVPFNKWMRKNIFDPANAKKVFYYIPGQEYQGIAHGYTNAAPDTPRNYGSPDGKWAEFDYGEAEFFLTKADRGAYASSIALQKWIRALYSGKIISEASLQQMMHPEVASNTPYESYGLGTSVCSEPGMPLRSFHINTNGGFIGVEVAWPETKLHYIILSNRNDWNPRRVVNSIDALLYANNML